ncbi:MAG: helix-turn-helix domain-containing protein, partial [Sulfurovum sp.]|nr:helix-turn-helix domain-containing protein [Sulfurovum sp.]
MFQELRKASSLLEAPNVDNKPSVDDLKALLANKTNTQERNETIAKAYKQGYSQHMIAKVLGLNQATVQRII